MTIVTRVSTTKQIVSAGTQGPGGPPGTGVQWKGAWSALTTYAINDGVSHDGSSYVANAAGLNHEPPNASYWDVLAAAGEDGDPGADGRTWYSGTGAPADGTGSNGDFYLRTDTSAWYGPKAAGTWTGTGPHSLIGDNGDDGTNGNTWHASAGAPGDGVGVNGDFALDTTASAWYGPKAAGTWSGTGPQSLIGLPGAAGTPKWEGAWSGGTAYHVGDAVSNDGSSYVCNQAHTNHEPPNASYWDVLAQQGSPSDTVDISALVGAGADATKFLGAKGDGTVELKDTPAGGSVFGGDGTASRALPTSGAASGEYWVVGDWTSTGDCAWTNVYIHCTGAFTLSAGHTITVTGGGKGAAEGSATTHNGLTAGSGQGLGGGGGGFYVGGGIAGGAGAGYYGSGGKGGTYAGYLDYSIPGQAYDLTRPLGGSGGGAGMRYAGAVAKAGGDGAGACYIEAAGAIIINGTINAIGAAGAAGVGYGGGGGGSGGAVVIRSRTSATLGASSVINVSGGAGGLDNTEGPGGGGSCGHVSIMSPSNTLTGGYTITMTGGAAGTTGGSGVQGDAGASGSPSVITCTPAPRTGP